MVFLYVNIVFVAIICILRMIVWALSMIIEIKLHILEDTFKTNKILELFVELKRIDLEAANEDKED